MKNNSLLAEKKGRAVTEERIKKTLMTEPNQDQAAR